MTDQFECEDPWEGQGAGGLAGFYTAQEGSGEILVVGAVPRSAVHRIGSGARFGAFKLIINHQKTVGGAACAGCEVPMCIRMVAMRVVMPSREVREPNVDPQHYRTEEQYVEITQGISGMGGNANVATWQGGAASCVGATSRPASWKQLKDMYRPR